MFPGESREAADYRQRLCVLLSADEEIQDDGERYTDHN
jgi:hypothetical protein